MNLTQIQMYPEEDHQGVTTDQGQGRCQNDVGHVLDLQWEENGQDLVQTPERRTKGCQKVHTKARGIDHPPVRPLSRTMMEVPLGSRILKRKRLKKSSKTRRKESKLLKIKTVGLQVACEYSQWYIKTIIEKKLCFLCNSWIVSLYFEWEHLMI